MQRDYLGRPETDDRLSIEIVTARAQLISDRHDRDLVYALQARAILDKGLHKFASLLVKSFPDRLGPKSMQQIGKPASDYYSADQVRAIRKEIPGGDHTFLLKGEFGVWSGLLDDPNEAAHHPSRYHHSAFVAAYQAELENLERKLESICISDEINIGKWAPWYFPRLIESCRELLAAQVKSDTSTFAQTSVTRSIFRAAEISSGSGKLTLVYGPSRLGKTFAATRYQKANPGRFRYVEVPVYAEDKEFFRELARALGFVGIDRLTASELRMQIEDVLRAGDITLIMDEAQYLLGSSVYPRSIPRRIAWICSLVNKGVGIVLITVPKFLKTLENLAKHTPWDVDQLFGRIAETVPLPNELGRDDLIAITRKWMPSTDEKALELVADLALATPEFLGSIQSTSARAIEIAKSQGRNLVELADVNEAAFNGNFASIRSQASLRDDCKVVAKPKETRRNVSAPIADGDSVSPRFTLPRINRTTAVETTKTAGK